ncbi:hypothetical protein TEA_014856 [Camellia sinensis var. sinensis]|uniref:ABC transmembrane type-1 domain-containing protein n=1 Tax=Camellia sinensis var. sinensis TaxID=542762 RepID=A0A4S4DQ01_CAMSN|nr:hypothetical protein TEA_014856 [Camellia sinensis var. sinensis]
MECRLQEHQDHPNSSTKVFNPSQKSIFKFTNLSKNQGELEEFRHSSSLKDERFEEYREIGDDLSQFVGPVLLNHLLQSMERGDPAWVGYIYAFSIFVGVTFIISKMRKLSKEGLQRTDKRVGLMNEILAAMDTVKYSLIFARVSNLKFTASGLMNSRGSRKHNYCQRYDMNHNLGNHLLAATNFANGTIICDKFLYCCTLYN